MSADKIEILRVDSSMRQYGSVSRELAECVVAQLRADLPDSEIVWRDLKSGVGHVNSAWRDASLGSPATRSGEDRALLAQSDALIAEVERADIMVFAVPIYNFSIPAVLKAWVDMVCRDNVDGATATFTGGRERQKQAIVIMTSNHTRAGADDEFATAFLQFILRFIGCTNVNMIDVTGLANDRAGIIRAAQEKIETVCKATVSRNISAAAE